MGVVTMSCSALLATLQFTESVHRVVYAIWICAFGFFISGTITTINTTTAKCFGVENHTKNYGLVVTGQSVGGLVMASITSSIFPQLSYLVTFLITAGILALSAIVAFFFPKMR